MLTRSHKYGNATKGVAELKILQIHAYGNHLQSTIPLNEQIKNINSITKQTYQLSRSESQQTESRF
jgi:hypothetical protein